MANDVLIVDDEADIRKIIAGERDADSLCEHLDLEDSMIVETILRSLTGVAEQDG